MILAFLNPGDKQLKLSLNKDSVLAKQPRCTQEAWQLERHQGNYTETPDMTRPCVENNRTGSHLKMVTTRQKQSRKGQIHQRTELWHFSWKREAVLGKGPRCCQGPNATDGANWSLMFQWGWRGVSKSFVSLQSPLFVLLLLLAIVIVLLIFWCEHAWKQLSF